jgi:MOSC domain-containing protein YiiM
VTGILKQISRSNGGLPKRAVDGPVMLDFSGVAGDRQRNLLVHGGREKAVLMIAAELIDSLIADGYPLFYGALGENLTVEGIDPHAWRSGQRWRIGDDATIELTELRMPCANLHPYGISLGAQLYDARCSAGDITSPRWAHGGFYARVIRGGLVTAGAPVVLESDVA